MSTRWWSAADRPVLPPATTSNSEAATSSSSTRQSSSIAGVERRIPPGGRDKCDHPALEVEDENPLRETSDSASFAGGIGVERHEVGDEQQDRDRPSNGAGRWPADQVRA